MLRIAPPLRWFRRGALVAAALAGAATGAGAQISGKWAPYIDLEAMPGTARSIGTADLFAPLYQNDSSLLFANLRGRADDLRNREGNLGLGFRQMEAGGWNVGAYGYVDRLQSSSSNLFDQVTLGMEALGPNWDFRANGYIPAGTTTKPVATASAVPVLIGGSIELAAANETALGGFDGEAGWRVPLWDVAADQQLLPSLFSCRVPDPLDGAAPMIYKICSQSDWREAEARGVFSGAGIDLRDGYIHFSTAVQARETAALHFAGVADLVLVAVDEASLGAALKWEPARDGSLFPHLYGALAPAMARWAKPLPLGPDGRHVFPDIGG